MSDEKKPEAVLSELMLKSLSKNPELAAKQARLLAILQAQAQESAGGNAETTQVEEDADHDDFFATDAKAWLRKPPDKKD